MPWSAQQQQAINTYDKNILVAAAAGSGKTSVLVERVIQRIVNKTCDINQILVVTFTNAAAAEMRERIASAITEKLSDKDKERQLVLLNASSISTLHAFCQNIIRQYFHQLGLDPKFRLANPQEIELLKHINEFKNTINDAARTRAPHKIANYIQRLAQLFHSFYGDCHVIDEENKELSSQRLALVEATRITLANALNLIGVHAPEKM